MNNPRDFENQVWQIFNEAVDLVVDEVEVTINRCRFYMESKETGLQVVVIPDPFNLFRERSGIHAEMDEGLDEYVLLELVEKANKEGHSLIYIHRQKAA